MISSVLDVLHPLNFGNHYIHYIAIFVLSLPHSNSESERVFPQVNLNKTDLRSQVLTETNESLLHAKYGFVNSNDTLVLWAPSKQMMKFSLLSFFKNRQLIEMFL